MEERSESRASGTTYHSFNEIEVFEPPSPPRPPVTYDAKALKQLEMLQYEQKRQQHHEVKERRSHSATRMQRQDSGYESITPRRTSTSNGRPTVSRRGSNGSSTAGSSGPQLRNRPSIRRTNRSHPLYNGGRNSNQSLHIVRTSGTSQPVTFFHFPSPDPLQLAEAAPDRDLAPTPVPTPPPRTTHYWTSDRTRRLEYAAIDAATRGVKGWVIKHLVPDCFIPKESRHVSFDDDSGSVRRYRLELEDDMTGHNVNIEKMVVTEETTEHRRKGWRFWRRRKNMTNSQCMVEAF